MSYQFDNLKLDKGMYSVAGQSFTGLLEKEDPSERYKGTALEGLDAYQRQLKRFDIKVKGAGSDVVDKFFQSAQSAVLFPEYVARTVRQGMEEADLLPAITAAVTSIEGMDYRSITSVPDKSRKELRRVEEGANIPQTQIRTQENLVKLHKRGRMLAASYEAIRHQKLDLFSVALRQIGAHISRQLLEDAIEVLENGDGNGNAAGKLAVGTAPIGGTAGSLTYSELVDFWAQFEPYEMNTLLVSGDVLLKLLKMEELQNPLTGLNFQGTGRLTTPLGATLLRTSALGTGKLIGLDKRYALEMVKAGDVLVEYDKLIDRQMERVAITSVAGFAKVFREASKVLAVEVGRAERRAVRALGPERRQNEEGGRAAAFCRRRRESGRGVCPPRSLTERAARSPSEARRRRCGGGLWGGAGLTGPTPAFGRGFVGAAAC